MPARRHGQIVTVNGTAGVIDRDKTAVTAGISDTGNITTTGRVTAVGPFRLTADDGEQVDLTFVHVMGDDYVTRLTKVT